MKILLAAFLHLSIFATGYTQSWPRSPQTGKIEFKGTLIWPARVKTEAQKQALVRKWYLAKLTSMSATAVKQEASTAVSRTLLTYAGLPNDVVMRYGQGTEAVLLAYQVDLSPIDNGLSCRLFAFDWTKQKEAQITVNGTPLEQVIDANTPTEQAALLALKKRLILATAGW